MAVPRMVMISADDLQAVHDALSRDRREGSRVCFAEPEDEWHDYVEVPMEPMDRIMAAFCAANQETSQ